MGGFSFNRSQLYFLYLDDSGSVNNKDENYFVLGGIAVPENTIRWLTHQIESLAKIYYEKASQLVEFHASEIFAGRPNAIWGKYCRPERKKALQDVLKIVTQTYANSVCFACAVHKDSFPNEDPVLKAYEDVSSRFNMYLESQDSKGIIVIDKSSYENSLQKLTTTFRDEGNRWGSQLRSIIEVPLFVDSKSCRIIQLADHISYAVFRRYNANDLTYFNIIEGKIYQRDNVYHGLAHLQTYNPNCSCPACATRKP